MSDPKHVLVKLDGDAIDARAGDTVAAALLRSGVTTFTRSIKYHRPRGPFCLDGTCGQCLMRIDGAPSVQACRTKVADGMQCERQNAPLGSADKDVLRAVDFVFAGGLDHHHIATFSKLAGQVALKVARTLAGLGHLPDRAVAPIAARVRDADVAVVGAGLSGLSAALGAAERDRDGVVLIEREELPGGSALLELEPAPKPPTQLAESARAAGVQLWLRSEAVGLYAPEEPQGRALVPVRTAEGLSLVRAKRVIVACGGVSQPLVVPGGDRPGVYAARGLIALARRHGVLAGGGTRASVVVAGEGRELTLCADALKRAGYEIAALADASTVVRVRGNPAREVQVTAGGEVRKVRCDAVAVALPPAPFHELATSVGASAQFDEALGGFAVASDAGGATSVPWLYVAGRVAGRPGDLHAAHAAGHAAAEAAHG